MTKVCCLSDTHGLHGEIEVPECDILLFAGDFSNTGRPNEVKSFLDWFSIQPAEHKIFIAGNHDISFQRNPKFKNECIQNYPNIHYLEDSSIEICNLKIYGSPFSPIFGNWAYMLPRGKEIQEKWSQIPTDTNILITHGPPAGIMDSVSFSGEHAGCRDLLNRIDQLDNLSLTCFGHIHQNFGQTKVGNTIFANVAIVDDNYEVVNQPMTIEV